MKITKIEFIPVRYPLKAPFYPAWFPGAEITSWGATVIKVHTDEGIVGYGTQGSIGTEVKTVGESQTIQKLLIGAAIFNVENIVQILGGVSYTMDTLRLWGIELAVWDVIGKSCGKPVYKLWGGGQDRVLAYASTGMLRSPKERAADAVKYRDMGFKAIKIRIHREKMEDDIAEVKAVRDAIGNDMEIMVDANQPLPWGGPIWSYQRALETARELDKLDAYWLEEPLHHDAHKDLARLADEVDVYIAGGEDEIGVRRFMDLLDKDCFDILQPDPLLSGGMLQMKKIAALAEAKNRMFVPHTWDSGINLAASLQVIGTVPNCPYVEYCLDLPAFDQGHDPLLKTPIEASKDGYVDIPSLPGLGIEVDESALEKYRVD